MSWRSCSEPLPWPGAGTGAAVRAPLACVDRDGPNGTPDLATFVGLPGLLSGTICGPDDADHLRYLVTQATIDNSPYDFELSFVDDRPL